jgi:hypothetical protein
MLKNTVLLSIKSLAKLLFYNKELKKTAYKVVKYDDATSNDLPFDIPIGVALRIKDDVFCGMKNEGESCHALLFINLPSNKQKKMLELMDLPKEEQKEQYSEGFFSKDFRYYTRDESKELFGFDLSEDMPPS